MGPKRSASRAHESVPKRKKTVMTLTQKVELLDMLRSGKSASAVGRHYGINESTVRSIKKQEREIREAVAAATSPGAKTLRKVRDPLISRTERATFVWLQDCHRQGIHVNSNTIMKKAKEVYDSLKTREGGGGTGRAPDFAASKGWFENFKRRFSLRNAKVTGESAFVDEEPAREFPATVKEEEENEEEEMVQEDKFTLDNIASALQMAKSAMDAFYDIDPSTMRALKVKRAMEEALIPYKTVFKEMKRQKSQREVTVYFPSLVPKTPSSPATSEASPSPSHSARALDIKQEPDDPLSKVIILQYS